MDYYIITGASRGLGEAIVEQLIGKETIIYYLSRTKNQALHKLASSKKVKLFFEECDLSNIDQAQAVFKKVLTHVDNQNAKKITLINNAGMVNPIKNVGTAQAEDMISNVHLNLLTPMLLSDMFIKHTKEFNTKAVIANITSGAANRPISGWSVYCSTKAGLNMFTNTIGVEQNEGQNQVMTIGFSPGVMDTEMQQTIRKADKEDFSAIDQFKEFHEKGMLRSPSFVAQVFVQLLSMTLENGRIYDVKEFV
ncbi:(S)-benzoin forming benzil reductase [Metabacillus litoralis]|uniref:(S)-benzoin forming benzil reductase n=1 Tax=Metabacillus litoralis TaxID=152268 RepID=UPI001CFE979B|nr:(S)-benzoin forming benzil reductase [Metabacillus litoralis]